MIRRYHDFDPYTAVKPMIPGVFCKECGNREENPNHRPPEPVIDWEARALAAEQALTEARAETDGHRERANSNFDEAVYAMAERDAARAELAELREQIKDRDEAIRWVYRFMGGEGDGIGPYPAQNIRDRLRRLANPAALASPVEPQPTEPPT